MTRKLEAIIGCTWEKLTFGYKLKLRKVYKPNIMLISFIRVALKRIMKSSSQVPTSDNSPPEILDILCSSIIERVFEISNKITDKRSIRPFFQL